MASTLDTITVKELPNLTVKIRLSRPLKLRLAVGIKLIRIGVWLLGSTTEIEEA